MKSILKGALMRAVLLLFLFVWNLGAYDSLYSEKINSLESKQLKVSVDYFWELYEKSKVARADVLSFVKQVEGNEGKALSGKQVLTLENGILRQIYLREELYRLINTYKTYPFLNEEENLISMDNRLKGGLLALASACVVADNYLLCLQQIQAQKALRRLVNKGDGGLKVGTEQLQAVVDSFSSRENRKKFRTALEWFLKHRHKFKGLAESAPELTELSDVVLNSPAAKELSEGNIFSDYFNKLTRNTEALRDEVAGLGQSSSNSISKIFGNGVGSIQFRNGLLYGQKKIVERISGQLKPLDIILEKTPFRLTDKFIPGHFGHVAIWVGSEKQLKEAGLWQHPVIQPYHEEIKKGCSVLEALRDGVQLNTLEHFLDVDDIAVLRQNNKIDNKALLRAFEQIGKEYDFNFDVETTDKIVCSELVYHVFVDIDWPTEKTMGRYTISPDNVAVKAVDGPFDVALFVHNGEDASYEKYKALISIEE